MTDDDLQIRHKRQGDAGRYWAEVPGGEAELTYRLTSEGVMAIDHTYTPPQARGKNIARRLTERAVADAQDQGRLVDPVCPYVATLFDRLPEWAPLRA